MKGLFQLRDKAMDRVSRSQPQICPKLEVSNVIRWLVSELRDENLKLGLINFFSWRIRGGGVGNALFANKIIWKLKPNY